MNEAKSILGSGGGGGVLSFLGGDSEVGGQIDVNVNAPKGAVNSVKSRRTRGGVRLNAGMNMATAG